MSTRQRALLAGLKIARKIVVTSLLIYTFNVARLMHVTMYAKFNLN